MPARRRLLWMSLTLSVGLLILALGSTQPPVDSGRPAPAPAPAPAPGPVSTPLVARIVVPAPTPPPAPLALGGVPVRATGGPPIPPRPPVVRARLGQLIELAVTPPQPDAISVVGFDRTHPGSPTTPARFSLVADRAGRFPLVLESSGQTVGLLEIGLVGHPSARRRARAS